MKIIYLLPLLIFFSFCTKEKKETAEAIQVIYQPNMCCDHLHVLEGTIDGPDNCLPYSLLYAINLDAFDIAQNNEFGDTLTIEYALAGDCEAQGDNYNCSITCDRRHGIPVEIISLSSF